MPFRYFGCGQQKKAKENKNFWGFLRVWDRNKNKQRIDGWIFGLLLN
jgi:hypothetical protein